MKPHALVTNDDGIDSAFLAELVAALLVEFKVSVAAPAFEQSWIGRAMTRRGDVEVIHNPSLFPGTNDAWAISGTPSDCVNIALGHLLPEKPDIVVSGINIGYNTTDTLILSSGTVAGAIEGAQWGLPAIAFSQHVPNTMFAEVNHSKGQTTGNFSKSLKSAAARAAKISQDVLAEPPEPGTVLNINFPSETHAGTQTVDTHPAKIEMGSLFEEVSPGRYQFSFHHGTTIHSKEGTDRSALEAGHISRSLLDFSKVGRR